MIKNFKIGLQEVGKIKIGGLGEERTSAKGTKYRLPVKFDHIEIVSCVRDAEGFYIPDPIMKKLGPKPMEIDAMLMYDDIDLNFPTCYALYEGKKCKCRGDGETAERHLKDGKMEVIPCQQDCKFLNEKDPYKPKCKVSGVLSCILPQSELIGGVYKFRTHGFNSVSNILGSLCFITSLTGGKLAGIPLKMVAREKIAEYEEKGEMKTSKVTICNIEFRGNIQSLRKIALQEAQERLRIGVDMKNIEDKIRVLLAKEETDEEAAEIQQEFYSNEEIVVTKPDPLAEAMREKKDEPKPDLPNVTPCKVCGFNNCQCEDRN